MSMHDEPSVSSGPSAGSPSTSALPSAGSEGPSFPSSPAVGGRVSNTAEKVAVGASGVVASMVSKMLGSLRLP